MMTKKTSRSTVVALVLVVLSVAVIVAMVIFFKIQGTGLGPKPTLSVIRLPKSIIPDRYEVFLHPHFYIRTQLFGNTTSDNQTEFFTGNSTLFFKCVQTSSAIYLHSSNLLVSDAVLRNVDTGEFVESTVEYHQEWLDILQINLVRPLEVEGNYSLSLMFEGWTSEYSKGMFLSSYRDEDPETLGFLAVTHLEPIAARTLFPCLDEPDLKAVFYLNVIHRHDSMVLGNAEVFETSIIDDEWKITRFYPTPKMSTYLFALAVSEFTATPSLHDRVKINTFARPEVTEAGFTLFAANTTGKILQFFEEMLGINYPQKKLDQIAVLYLDSGIAGMENWGLITYLEEVLLYEEGVSSLLQKETITEIIAHELAHQWFGNLVTMKWWNELWLNEGFATYMSFKAVDHVEPCFRTEETSVAMVLHSAFTEDALVSSLPLVPPPEKVQAYSDIIDMFDYTTYTKGAMILRMLADVVEERVFNKGVRSYLLDFSYRNSETKDLWNHIQKAVDEDGGQTRVAQVMELWTTQNGYPVVTINTISGEVSQKHFLFNSSSKSSHWWTVPIRVMSRSSGPSLVLLDTSSTVKKEEFISKNKDWVLANVNWTGFYRVNYDPENWQSLLSQLETQPQKIPVMNRGQLIDDAFNLARAKLVNVTLALNVTRFLRNETAFLPWKSAINNLEYFIHMFDRSEVYGPLQAYLRRQVSGLYHFFRNYTDVSTVPQDHALQHNQVLAIEVGCSSGLPECVSMAKTMFSKWMNNNNSSIHPNLRSTVYCQAVAAGGVEEWEHVWRTLESTSDMAEKEYLQKALACTRKVWLLNRYLQYALNPEKIQPSDVSSVITFIVKNVVGQALAWNFVRANWEAVKDESAQLIESLTNRFSTQFELEEMQRFFVDNNMEDSVMAKKRIEEVQVNIQWVNEHRDVLHQWFLQETAV